MLHIGEEQSQDDQEVFPLAALAHAVSKIHIGFLSDI
jgi:hypothetical protein